MIVVVLDIQLVVVEGLCASTVRGVLLGFFFFFYFFFLLGKRRRGGVVRRHKVGVGLRQAEGALDGVGRMATANLGKALGADGVVLVVDDGRSPDGIAGTGLPLPVLLVEEGVVKRIPLGLEGPAVLGR